jgi:hypothetical protein
VRLKKLYDWLNASSSPINHFDSCTAGFETQAAREAEGAQDVRRQRPEAGRKPAGCNGG